VLKSDDRKWDVLPKGLEIKRWAVALLAVLKGILLFDIFSKADASPSGYRVKRDPDASAKNSLFRETASWIRVAIIGERIANTTPIIRKI